MQVGRVDTNSRVTHYVVQSYRKMGKRLVAEEPRVVKDERECLRVAEAAASRRHAVIAFSRTGDADTGDFDDPVILATHGEVPEMV
jgi:hypothetical protein